MHAKCVGLHANAMYYHVAEKIRDRIISFHLFYLTSFEISDNALLC